MRSLKQLSFMSYRDSGNDNRAKVKNDGSGISPNTFEPLSFSKAVLKAAAREVSNGSNNRTRDGVPEGLLSINETRRLPSRQCQQWGHEDQFMPPRRSCRSAFCVETFAGRCGYEKDALVAGRFAQKTSGIAFSLSPLSDFAHVLIR